VCKSFHTISGVYQKIYIKAFANFRKRPVLYMHNGKAYGKMHKESDKQIHVDIIVSFAIQAGKCGAISVSGHGTYPY